MLLLPAKIACFSKATFNTNLASASPNFTWSLSVRFYHQNHICGFHLPLLFHTPGQSQLSSFDFNDNICRRVQNYAPLTQIVSMCCGVQPQYDPKFQRNMLWLQEKLFIFVEQKRSVEDFTYWLQCGLCGVIYNRNMTLKRPQLLSYLYE